MMERANLYRAVWHWHFYAGLIVLPVLAWMAVTGGLYLYKQEIERWLYADWVVARSIGPPMRVDEMIRQVESQTGGRVRQVARPADADESWRMTYAEASGEVRLAFVRPDVGLVLGTSRDGGPMELIKHLHSLTVAGPVGNVLIEVVAGWAILLVLTGLYLWWPRAGNRALSLAGRVGERRFWRNLHASTGALAGAVILFLAVTGMPWTIFWGESFHAFVASQQIGRPAPPSTPANVNHSEHEDHLPWGMRDRPQPRPTGPGDLGPDRAVAAASARGLRTPWMLDLPREAGRPYRLASAAERTDMARMIYVDPASSAVLQDVSFADYGIGARAFEWGIYTHQGGQYGEFNRLIMLAGCISVLLLTISAPVMWWKRRDLGRLRAPPPPQNPSVGRGLAVLLLTVGVTLPLTGATMLVAAGVRALVRKRSRAG